MRRTGTGTGRPLSGEDRLSSSGPPARGRAASATASDWTDRLQRVVDDRCSILERVRVIALTASTQDAARRFGPTRGDVVPALRQTAGRGRRGRRWHDTADEGVAVSVVVAAAAPERLVRATAVGVAEAIEPFLGRLVGLKWPNDVYVDGRKIAGVLVEQNEATAVIGIGINVAQTSWPEELARRAVSLRQLGATPSRLEVLETLLPSIDAALARGTDQLAAAFGRRQVEDTSVR